MITRFISIHNDGALFFAAIAIETIRTWMRTVYTTITFAAYALARLKFTRRIVIAFAFFCAIVAEEAR